MAFRASSGSASAGRWLLILFCLGQFAAAFAGPEQDTSLLATQYFQFSPLDAASELHTESHNLVAEKIIGGGRDSFFLPSAGVGHPLPGRLFWAKARLPAELLGGRDWVIEIAEPMASITAWARQGDSPVVQLSQVAGPTPAVALSAQPGITISLALHLDGTLRNLPEVRFWRPEAWQQSQRLRLMWLALLAGGVVALAAYPLFFVWRSKAPAAIFYGLHLLAFLLLVMTVAGLPRVIEGVPAWWTGWLALSAGFGVLFCQTFLAQSAGRLRSVGTVLSAGLLLLGVIAAMAGEGSLMDGYRRAVAAGAGLALLYCLLLAGLAYLRGHQPARFLLPAYATTVGGYALFAGNAMAGGPESLTAWQWGGVLMLQHTIWLSMAWVDQLAQSAEGSGSKEKKTVTAQRRFSRQVINIQESERERFSNTLHDSVGHELLVLKRAMQSLADTESCSQDVQRRLSGLTEQCADILTEVRGLSHDLHPHTLKRLGLKAAIESTADIALSGQDLDYAVAVNIAEDRLQEEQKIAVYRIVQEALNNILKHAKANEVILSLRNDDRNLFLEIKDDGIGIPEEKTIIEGIGFSTMSGRAELLGGWMKVQSSPAQGTILRFGIPLT